MITAEDVSFEYPTVRALDRVSLTVEAGAIAALVGPNGAGKTTLLRCLAALERPFSGRVRIDGLDTQDHPRQVHARLGYLPDFFGLYDELTVAQSLFFAARAHGIPGSKASDAAARAAERVQLNERMATPAGDLSRGLRQRLAIAQVIVHEPKVLLLDEPASGLDPEARRDLSRLLLTLKDLGITQLVSSHILAELEDYSTHMIIMDRGRIVSTRRIDEADAERLVRIELAGPDERLATVLAGLADIRVVEVDGRAAVVALSGNESAQADLLRRLMAEGLAVAGVTAHKRRLEDAYFEDIGQGGSQPAESRG